MLKHYLNRHHAQYNEINAFIKKKAQEIPDYKYSCSNKNYSLETYLADEFFEACCKTIFLTEVTTSENIRFFKYTLSTVSKYRYVLEYTAYPLGIAVEYFLFSRNLKCPISSKCLTLNGGSNGAWSDLTCKESLVNVEVKTKVRNRYPYINGGSYRWYKAQEKAGIRNFLVIVPRNGGTILMSEIANVRYSIDNRFCAYYNSKYRDEASLRSYVTLKNGHSIGNVKKSDLDLLEQKSTRFMKRLAAVYFGSVARKIQRMWRIYHKANSFKL